MSNVHSPRTLRKMLQLWELFSFLIVVLEDKSEGVTEFDSVERIKIFLLFSYTGGYLVRHKKMILEKKEKYSTFI